MIKKMIEYLNNIGFKFIGTCNCDGRRATRKYKRGEWLIYLGVNNFKAKKNGITVKNWSQNTVLENYISAAIPSVPAGK